MNGRPARSSPNAQALPTFAKLTAFAVMFGIVTNVLVCWGLNLWGTMPYGSGRTGTLRPSDDLGRDWIIEPQSHWTKPTGYDEHNSFSLTIRRTNSWSSLAGGPPGLFVYHHRLESGWPLRAMAMDSIYEVDPIDGPWPENVQVYRQGYFSGDWIHSIARDADARTRISPDQHLEVRGLPYRILPAGFAVNVSVYAAIFLVGWIGAKQVKAWRRRQAALKGQCYNCGYIVRFGRAARCPECGEESKDDRNK